MSERTVQLSNLATLSISRCLEDACQVNENTSESTHVDEEPEPLDSGDSRDGTHVLSEKLDDCNVHRVLGKG